MYLSTTNFCAVLKFFLFLLPKSLAGNAIQWHVDMCVTFWHAVKCKKKIMEQRMMTHDVINEVTFPARDNFSTTVEIRLRPTEAQWRYKLNVLVNQKYLYFDRYPEKMQIFRGIPNTCNPKR